MFNHNKNLGQHFLNNPAIINSIIDYANPQNCSVLEIGPGLGVLTKELVKTAHNVVAIELDKRLENTLKQIKQTNSNFNYIIGNALHLQPNTLPISNLLTHKKIVVANLPYNVGTQIFLNYLHLHTYFNYMVLMLQLEVALRIVATVGSKNYGRLSIISNTLANCQLLFNVDKQNFTPPPAVQSAVIKVQPYCASQIKVNLQTLKKVTNLAFSGKRKTVKNSLGTLNLDFTGLNIDSSLRAENLTLQNYWDICNYLDKTA